MRKERVVRYYRQNSKGRVVTGILLMQSKVTGVLHLFVRLTWHIGAFGENI